MVQQVVPVGSPDVRGGGVVGGDPVVVPAPMPVPAGVFGAPRLFDVVCHRRGWTAAVLAELTDPYHAPIPGVDGLVAALRAAYCEGAVICVAPDFDADGITAGLVAYAALAEMGFAVRLQIPDHRTGHEFSPVDVAMIADQHPDTQVVLTVDAGINSHEGIAAAHARGWRVWVTDHHVEVGVGCSADVVVDPCRLGSAYPHPGLCGAHVVYRVMVAYARAYCPDRLVAVGWLRALVALGTIADVMPLVHENRDVVVRGVGVWQMCCPPAGRWDGASGVDAAGTAWWPIVDAGVHDPRFLAVFRGMVVWLHTLRERRMLADVRGVDADLLGWTLAPMLNSPRRIDGHVAECFALFTRWGVDLGRSVGERDAELRVVAGRLVDQNQRRKDAVAEQVRVLVDRPQPDAPWVYRSPAPAGMLGLLANRMMSEHGHPVVVLGDRPGDDGRFSGSARAPAGFDVITLVGPLPGMGAVGHARACGVWAVDAAHVALLAGVLADATARLSGPGGVARPVADVVIAPGGDVEPYQIEQVVGLAHDIADAGPWGPGFERPVIDLVVDPGAAEVGFMGAQGQHVCVTTGEGLRCVWWNAASVFAGVWDGRTPVVLRGCVGVDVWAGRERVQFVVDDARLFTGLVYAA